MRFRYLYQTKKEDQSWEEAIRDVSPDSWVGSPGKAGEAVTGGSKFRKNLDTGAVEMLIPDTAEWKYQFSLPIVGKDLLGDRDKPPDRPVQLFSRVDDKKMEPVLIASPVEGSFDHITGRCLWIVSSAYASIPTNSRQWCSVSASGGEVYLVMEVLYDREMKGAPPSAKSSVGTMVPVFKDRTSGRWWWRPYGFRGPCHQNTRDGILTPTEAEKPDAAEKLAGRIDRLEQKVVDGFARLERKVGGKR